MKKIGLFLGITPHMGGAFQYSQTLLKATSELPRNEFAVIVYYTDKVWEKHLPADIERRYIKPRLLKYSYFCGIAVTLSCFPVRLWRYLAAVVDPLARRCKRENCDLWVFSALSFSCYQLPVPAVGVIHDLMHRYERFPENSSPLIYYWRERCFKRMIKWCKAIFVESETGKTQLVESYHADPAKILVQQLIPPAYMYS
ncbi:MAG: glycosyltransferase, partial [Victivallales bacterium]|nr:glycosyltransferase [Victivallales bacterium]